MTEAVWLSCDDPARMLTHLIAGNLTRGFNPISDRKLRLFACACCRQIWCLLTDERSRQAVQVAERHADGCVGREELETAGMNAWVATRQIQRSAVLIAATEAAADAAALAAVIMKADIATPQIARAAARAAGENVRDIRPGQAVQAALLREIVGNPWRPRPHARQLAQWVSDYGKAGLGIAGMADLIYWDRDWEALPILADRLEESGCDSRDMLDHLRSSDPHVRGCWCLDLLLGKE